MQKSNAGVVARLTTTEYAREQTWGEDNEKQLMEENHGKG